MVLQRSRLACSIVLLAAGCSQDFVALPEASNVKGWLLRSSPTVGYVFGATEPANFDLVDGVRLDALPATPAELGVASGTVFLGEGRPLSMLDNYVWQEPRWTPSEASRVELRFDVDSCSSRCLKLITCPNCSVTPRMQGCGTCPAELNVSPPLPPDRVCPPGWDSREEPDGHQVCSAPRPPGFEEPCGAGQRWSIQDAGCIDVAPCAEPVLPPEDVAFVAVGGGPTGSGSATSPFGTLAEALATSASTIVMRPGTFTERVSIARPVTILGHGACTELGGPVGGPVVSVASLNVVLDGLSISTDGDDALAHVELGASLTIRRSHLRSRRQAVLSFGSFSLDSSLVERIEGCIAGCEAKLLNLSNGGVVASSEIRGARPLGVPGGDFRLLDSRVLGEDSAGRGLAFGGAGSVAVHRSAILGFHTCVGAMTPGTVDVRDSWFTSVNMPTPESLWNGASIALSNTDSQPTTAQIERVDIKSGGFGIQISNANLTARQLRIDSIGTALYQAAEQGALLLSIDSAWIDYASFGLWLVDIDADLLQVWLRHRPGLSVEETGFFSGIVGSDQRLKGRRIHIIAEGENGILGFRDFDVEDLIVRGAGSAAVDNQRARSFEPDIRGRRWSLESDGTGLTLVGNFDLQDVRVKAKTEAAPSTPVCLHLRSSGSMRRFSLSTAQTQNAILVLDPAFREVSLEAVTFAEGSIDAGKFIAATSDCVRPQPGLDSIPSMDDVAYR